ncbi:MAG: hypothetical protein QOJ26_1309 [Thermoplasmata archaeon]|nr:hypothetical protein [Thermoplasmata archaeon]
MDAKAHQPRSPRLEPRDPEFEAKVRDSFARQGIMKHLGAQLETVEPGLVEISLPYRRELSQQHDYFHAGVVATIADSAAGYSAFSLMPAGSSVLSVEFKVNLIAPADGSRLIARGKVVRSGRTITVCQMEAEVEKGGVRTLCMVGQATMMCLAGTPDRPSG